MAITDTNPKHVIISAIATIIVAAVSGFTATRVAHTNAQTEYLKASLGYDKIADRMNKIETHVDAIEKDHAQINGTLSEMNKLLQTVFESQTGKTHVDTAPPGVKRYSEYTDDGRPPIRYPIGYRRVIPKPKEAATVALKGLQTLEKKNENTKTKVLPKLDPLPPKLDGVADSK